MSSPASRSTQLPCHASIAFIRSGYFEEYIFDVVGRIYLERKQEYKGRGSAIEDPRNKV